MPRTLLTAVARILLGRDELDQDADLIRGLDGDDLDRPVAVRTADGTTEPLGAFLDLLARRSGRSITTLARAAGISRAFYYVVRDGSQIPSIETLAGLFTALDIEFRLTEADEEAAFAVSADGEDWEIHLPYDRKREAKARAVREMSLNLNRASSERTGPTERAPRDRADRTPGAAIDSARIHHSEESDRSAVSEVLRDRILPEPSRADLPRAARTFVVAQEAAQRPRSAREQRLLSELLSAASSLDPERLEHLLDTVRLLADRR